MLRREKLSLKIKQIHLFYPVALQPVSGIKIFIVVFLYGKISHI
jgi:hypothetical protein